MRRFIFETTLFLFLLHGLLVFSAFTIPNVGLKGSMYYALLDKHKALADTPSPRIILVGGSNLSFGIDSQQIQEAFGMNVINTGLHMGLGLNYMMKDLTPFINRGDIIILVPEYDYFVTGKQAMFHGSLELLYVLFDVYPHGRKIVSAKQWLSLAKYIPHYASRKITTFARAQIRSLWRRKETDSPGTGVYDRSSFNRYGDVVTHWKLASPGATDYFIKGEIKYEAISFLNEYKNVVEQKGARIFFLYPSLREVGYQQSKDFINRLSTELRTSLNIKILTEPERALLNDEHIFDTHYHLNKSGVDIRTKLLIEDIKDYIRIDES